MSINSAILLEIWNRFKEEGIEFPFPQQEVRILNDGDDPIALNNLMPHDSQSIQQFSDKPSTNLNNASSKPKQ